MTKKQWLQAGRFVEMLQQSFEMKVENSNKLIKLLQEENIEYRFVYDSKDDITPAILVAEEILGDFAGLLVQINENDFELELDRSSSETFETIEEISFKQSDVKQVVETIKALILCHKLGFMNGMAVEKFNPSRFFFDEIALQLQSAENDI